MDYSVNNDEKGSKIKKSGKIRRKHEKRKK